MCSDDSVCVVRQTSGLMYVFVVLDELSIALSDAAKIPSVKDER
jgi:hypothetical protein